MKTSLLLLFALALFGCKQTADQDKALTAFDLNDMDTSVRLCDNFYQHAVGNWIQENPIPNTESRWAVFDVLNESNKKKLESIIAALVRDKSIQVGTNEQKIRDFYRSGLDSTARDKKGVAVVQSYFEEIDQAQNKQELNELLVSYAPLGVKSPVGVWIGADQKHSAEHIVYVGQSGLNLPDRDYYLLDDSKFKSIRSNYVKHIDKMSSLFGQADVKGKDVLDFETRIATIQWTRAKRRMVELNYNRTDLKNWSKSFEHFEFARLFQKYVGDFDTLIVSQPSYFVALDKLYSNSSMDQLKAYIKWNLMRAFTGITSLEIEHESFNFYSKKLKGIEEMKPLSERMFYAVNGHLGEPLGQLFVAAHFDEESKAYVSEMVENLRSAYRMSIKNLVWMSDETKQKAIKKLEAFNYKIGYPEEWIDYSEVQIDSNNYASNVIAVRKFNHQRMLEKLGEPVDRKEWKMTPQRVNAYYSSSNNEIVFPAGILQPPFFHKDFDDAINYGGIGAVIGHEFSHGFDDRGRKFDWDGNFSNWWTSEDSAKFMDLAAQLGAQYSAYEPVEGFHINGDFTMGENIADLGGLTLAYDALQLALGNNPPAPIDGYSWQQRFFLGWANIWKGSYKEERLIMQLKSDNHSPGEYRVLGPLVNLPAFYEAFGTCRNQAMFKPDSTRIKIW